MASDSNDVEDGAISCAHCEDTFEKREERDEHLREAHNVDPEEGGETAEKAAAADSEAAGSTGSILTTEVACRANDGLNGF